MAEHRNDGGSEVLLLGAAGAALYFFWPQISSMFSGSSSPAATQPSTAALPPASTPSSSMTTPSACGSGFTQDVAGVCTRYTDAALLADLNSIPWTGLADIPAEQIDRIDPQILAKYSATTGVNAGTVLAYMLGVGGAAPDGTIRAGSDGNSYKSQSGVFYRQGTKLAGIKKLRLRGPAALIAQTALNQMLADGGPQVTNGSPIGPWTPGAVRLPGGCWQYGNTPVLVNCPPGAVPPPPRSPAGSCQPGFTMDAAGICARVTDQAYLAQLNSTPAGSSSAADVTALFDQISPSILGQYTSTIGVMPGSVLSRMLGLPANPSDGTIEQGNDGFNYQTVGGTYIRQGTATQSTRATGPIGPRMRLKGLGALSAALPITNATLIAASNDPEIAAVVGNDPRAMLTIPQWNYYYAQASGVPQGTPSFPEIDPNALISAQQYQAWRRSAGLSGQVPKLGIIRNSRPGAFPLGGISDGPARVPFTQPGNRNIYRVPGRGSVTRGAVRLGLIQSGGGNHRWARSPFPRPADWRMAE